MFRQYCVKSLDQLKNKIWKHQFRGALKVAKSRAKHEELISRSEVGGTRCESRVRSVIISRKDHVAGSSSSQKRHAPRRLRQCFAVTLHTPYARSASHWLSLTAFTDSALFAPFPRPRRPGSTSSSVPIHRFSSSPPSPFPLPSIRPFTSVSAWTFCSSSSTARYLHSVSVLSRPLKSAACHITLPIDPLSTYAVARG